MDERKALAWLGRKVCWGLTPGKFDAWLEIGVDGAIEELLRPDDFNIAPRADRFRGINPQDPNQGRMSHQSTLSWIENAATSPRPFETFMEFFWSDFWAASFAEVRPRWLMLGYMNQLAELSLGNFANMLREMSRNPAMLSFLDGASNTKESPNENYARELLELYSVGVGHFNEDDVLAASKALTGWHLFRSRGAVEFRPFQHDDSPQVFLGVSGVRNLADVIDTIVENPATSTRIVGLLAEAILGPGYDVDLTTDLVRGFANNMELSLIHI